MHTNSIRAASRGLGAVAAVAIAVFAAGGCTSTDELELSSTTLEAKVNGKKLFERETFAGNGRTCAT